MIKFDGASDDLVYIDGCEQLDEVGCFEPRGIITGTQWSGTLQVDGVRMLRVFALYGGTWGFAVSPVDDETPLPDWKIEIGQSSHCEYSAELRIHAPEGTQVVEDQ